MKQEDWPRRTLGKYEVRMPLSDPNDNFYGDFKLFFLRSQSLANLVHYSHSHDKIVGHIILSIRGNEQQHRLQ